MVVAVTAALEGEVVEWVVDLHTEHAQELADAGLFLEAQWIHFKDGTRAQRAEGKLLVLTQRAWPAL